MIIGWRKIEMLFLSSFLHSKGILCLADEVQSGFYRSGTHMWGFQTYGDGENQKQLHIYV